MDRIGLDLGGTKIAEGNELPNCTIPEVPPKTYRIICDKLGNDAGIIGAALLNR